MSKQEYVEALNKILGAINDTADEIENPSDFINLLRLQFDVLTAAYKGGLKMDSTEFKRVVEK